MQQIVRVARDSGVFVRVLRDHGRTAAVLVDLDGHLWAVYPDPVGTGHWVAALCGPDGLPLADSELWIPLLESEQGVPAYWWQTLLDGNEFMPATWGGRPAPPLPLVADTAGAAR